jgi:hypothetical protein
MDKPRKAGYTPAGFPIFISHVWAGSVGVSASGELVVSKHAPADQRRDVLELRIDTAMRRAGASPPNRDQEWPM